VFINVFLIMCLWNLVFPSIGDKVEAVVPFMGESVTDGTLANFLKSMLSQHFKDYAPPSLVSTQGSICSLIILL